MCKSIAAAAVVIWYSEKVNEQLVKNAMKMLIFKAIEMLRRLDYQSFVLLSMFSSPFYQFHLVSTVRIHSINLSV